MTTAHQGAGSPAEFEALVALAVREQSAGRLAAAAAAYRRVLVLRPDEAEIHNELGSVLKDQGQLDEAAVQFERALALRPDLAGAHYNLGDVRREQGQLDEAVARYRQAIVLWPDFAEAHSNLGAALWLLGNLEEAAAHCERALALKPGLVPAHNNLGNILGKQGRFDEAAARFEQAIALRPDCAEAHSNLGRLLVQQRKFAEAATRYERLLALRPDHVETYISLGSILRQQGRIDEAAARFEQAIALRPHCPEAHNELAVVLKSQGKLDEAVARSKQALALGPGLAAAHVTLASIRRIEGKLDEAAAEYDQALALRPDLAEVHYMRANLKTFRAGDADLAALEALAADAGGPAAEKMEYVHFALGKALDDLGDHRGAFRHWLQGNALKRRNVDYNEAACQGTFRLIADLFTASLLDRFSGGGDPSPAPIFILGMPRSGSTLVEQILASHPQIHAAGELPNLEEIVRPMTETGRRPVPFLACQGALDAASLRRLGRAYVASLPTLAEGKSRITDKMPGNFLYVGLIRLILPNARIIHTVRDPVDTCLSCFSKLFDQAQAFSYDLAELGRYYRGYHELMAHWRSVLPAGAMLDVSYEELVGDLEQQARRLIDYCGLSWDDRCLSFHKTIRPVGTSSGVQVRRPLYRDSIARWRRYEADLQPLLAELENCRRPE